MEMSKTQIHMIGNAHIDIIWLWKWEEGLQEVRATFRSALDRIREHDDFIFTCACAYYYQLVERMDPALFEQIRKAVEAGRWRIVGGWWLQPDCNAPSGESYVRQSLYGQGYFKEKFGRIAKVGYNVDSFGHNGNLPQIYSKSGMDSYVFMRPGESEKVLPAYLFTWEGIDGSPVTAFRLPSGYTSTGFGAELEQKIKESRDIQAKGAGVPLMCFYGVGNHGGGPTRENLRILDAVIQKDPTVAYSDPETYFEQVRHIKNLPVVRDEMQFHAIGCYSSLSRIKTLNNQTEQRLLFTEKMLAIIGGADQEEQARALGEGWKKVLVNQFHDSMGGCSMPDAYPKIFNAYSWCLETASEISVVLFQRLAAQIKTTGEGSTLIVWNPHPWEVTQCIEVGGYSAAVQDLRGNAVPFEVAFTGAITGHYILATRFAAVLPPLGYTAYKLMGHPNNIDLNSVLYTRTGSNRIVSGALELHIDRESGAITSLFDREKNLEYLGGEGIGFEVIDDDSDTWTHALSSYKGLKRKMELESFTLVCQGQVTTEYELVYQFSASTVIVRAIVNGGLKTVDLKVRVIWNEKHRLLKLRITSAFKARTFVTEIPYGAIERSADEREWPIQRWIALAESSDAGSGLAILNDGVYSCSAEQDAEGRLSAGLTLLRSPIFANHEPHRHRPDMQSRYVDQGEHEYHFQLRPWAEKTGYGEHTRHALELNQPPEYVIESNHDGKLPPEQSYCRVSQDSSVIISTIKRAENDEGWVVRAVEAGGQKESANIDFTWLKLSKDFQFGPFEIKTIYISDKDKSIRETNLLEV
ncbi:hypothetical protein FACS1894163_09770 [Spirochaetia bacterium]|nr:hypothetical protein FACS1894163_09770 [Spirochaetia bacterium]